MAETFEWSSVRQRCFRLGNGFEHVDVVCVGAAAYPGHFHWIDVLLLLLNLGKGVVSGRGVRWRWNPLNSLYRGVS